MEKKLKPSKLRYLILKAIDDNDTINSKELGLSPSELNDFIMGMQKDGLIDGVIATKDRLIVSNTRITLIGEQYLASNSGLAKSYKAAKEVRDWITFIW